MLKLNGPTAGTTGLYSVVFVHIRIPDHLQVPLSQPFSCLYNFDATIANSLSCFSCNSYSSSPTMGSALSRLAKVPSRCNIDSLPRTTAKYASSYGLLAPSKCDSFRHRSKYRMPTKIRPPHLISRPSIRACKPPRA